MTTLTRTQTKMTQPDFINEAYKEAEREQTDQQLIETFIYELDKRGYNLWILKGIRSLLRQPNSRRGGEHGNIRKTQI